MKVYLDNGATTMVAEQVIKKMKPYFSEKYGNASSMHQHGQEAKRALENARHIIAKSIKASAKEIIFTSGGTESNNLAIKGIAFANKDKGRHIITTKIEHDCVLNACKFLEKHGFKITYLNVDKQGFVKPEDLEKTITDKTILVSVIHGNNEIGTIQNLSSLYGICKKHGVYFHTDACQSYTKTDLSIRHADLITLNAHKIHGPKGVGALFIKQGTEITPLMHGGGQERGMRSGTENIPGIVGFSEAVKLAMKRKHIARMTKLRNIFIKQMLEQIPDSYLNGPHPDKTRLCNNINIRFNGIEGEALGMLLDADNICTSTGSACSSKSLEPSHVLLAIGLSKQQANSSVRLTLSRYTTKEEIDYALEKIKKHVAKLRSISPLWKKIAKRLQN